MEYIVNFDTIDNGWFEIIYEADNLEQVIEWVEDDLEEHGGGLADISNSNGEFVECVEI